MRFLSTVGSVMEYCSQTVRPLGLVPTMGYLHEGHLELIRKARGENTTVLVSIFINPAQFSTDEDYKIYPRDLQQDLILLQEEGVDLVFAPTVAAMFPYGSDTWVEVNELGRRLEGKHRPGHFRGVTTVVAKLFNIVRPDRAYFGQKDGQQVVIIRRMVADLDVQVDVVVVPTVRGADGVAMSSRNTGLTITERSAASVIFSALMKGQESWEQGERDAEVIRREVRRVLQKEVLIKKIDYVSVANMDTLEELDTVNGAAMISVAVWMGRVRLIDNVVVGGSPLSARP